MKNANIQFFKHPTKDILFSSTAEICEKQLRETLISKDKASFIIPGGTTPGPLFAQLSKSPLDWSKVTIAQSDERWVDREHSQSNQKLTEEMLLINQAAIANYVAMKNEAASAKDGEAKCNQFYAALASPFSLTMLGMGLDGHIASLFPNPRIIEQGLTEGKTKQCVAIDATGCKVAGDYPERMSLTFDAILNSELIIILMIGQAKFQVVSNALNNTDPNQYPISALLNQENTPVQIHWCE